jgi:hypothetical protein
MEEIIYRINNLEIIFKINNLIKVVDSMVMVAKLILIIHNFKNKMIFCQRFNNL